MKSMEDLNKQIVLLLEEECALKQKRISLELYRHLLYQEKYIQKALAEYIDADK